MSVQKTYKFFEAWL